MARQGYSAEFRRKVLDRLGDGHSVASVAHDLDLSDQTIYNLPDKTGSTAAWSRAARRKRTPSWRRRRSGSPSWRPSSASPWCRSARSERGS